MFVLSELWRIADVQRHQTFRVLAIIELLERIPSGARGRRPSFELLGIGIGQHIGRFKSFTVRLEAWLILTIDRGDLNVHSTKLVTSGQSMSNEAKRKSKR